MLFFRPVQHKLEWYARGFQSCKSVPKSCLMYGPYSRQIELSMFQCAVYICVQLLFI